VQHSTGIVAVQYGEMNYLLHMLFVWWSYL
jgi:hypothetical protein